jgi:predicted SprT family Zn-dependent metalloprotease
MIECTDKAEIERIFALILADHKLRCPYCREHEPVLRRHNIKRSLICPHCQKLITPERQK